LNHSLLLVLLGFKEVIFSLYDKFPELNNSLLLVLLGFKEVISILGVGLGAEVVAGFADAHKSAILHGFPDTIDTYGLISGLWTSVFALGAFVGPTVAGILFDAVGFPYGTLFIIVTQLLALFFLAGFFVEYLLRFDNCDDKFYLI